MLKNKRNRIKLTEEGLRNFVSYSVARILKESYYGRPIFDRHGEYDGSEAGSYGENSYVFEPDIEKYVDSEDFEDVPFPQVKVYFTKTEGMKGDGYLQPDDPDEYELDSWTLLDKEKYPREIVDAVEKYMENDFDLEDSISSNLYEGKNLGVTFHSNGEDTYKPENPYGDMTWDEYVKAKADEHEKENEFPETSSDGKNLGVTFHSNGENHEKTPEDMEDEKHMFDDDYWVGKMNLSKEDLAEMVNKSVRLIAERINLNEISKGLLNRARESAHKDMMRNFGDSKIRNKRERQWKKFGDEYRKMDQEEKDSICPQVDERDLVNMPEDTYVVLNGDGRDAVNADFRTSYSGHAGTKEQCEEYVKRFYDTDANWEYLPEIVPLEEYLNSKRGQ